VSVLVVGGGGIGGPVARILVEAGVRGVAVADPDTVALENLHRQILFDDGDLGRGKAEVLARKLGVEAVPVKVDAANGPALVRGRACVVDGTDSFADKYVLNDLCLSLGVPLVHAGAAQFRGQVLLVRPGGPCLRCLLPEPPDARTDECRVTGIFGPAAGVVAALAAAEALRALAGDPAPAALLLADLASGRLERARLVPLAGCRCQEPTAHAAGRGAPRRAGSR
jgi:molybdopterin/thiamine biosynthesis adenylyltransferase